jgi:hypothetical protein
MELKEPEKEVEYKPVVLEDGTVKLKKKANIKRGAKSRAGGGAFELRARKDLEAKGWIVDKWSNNLDLETDLIHPAKRRFARFNANMGVMTIGTGFPDFIAFQLMDGDANYRIIGVEVKMNGKLSKIEKDKCRWYLKNKIFNEIWIARKVKEKNRVKVVYDEFEI